MLTALTRAVSPTLDQCALTFHDRQPIDVALAMRQHQAYEECLRRLGVRVVALSAEPELPDAVFVEDTAVVVDEVAVMTAPALESRRREVPSMAAALEAYRPLRFLTGTAALEGGDVMRIGKTLFVGATRRTNHDGIAQLAAALEPYGYRVRAIEVTGCLHLKSACTYIGRDTVLANRAWADLTPLDSYDLIDVPASEPAAANAVLAGDDLLMPSSFPRTAALLRERGFRVHTVDVSELQKAEAAVTCCSILFETDG